MKHTRDECIKIVQDMCTEILKSATNVANMAYINDLEDEQFWLDYQDELNKLSVERKRQ